MKGRFIFIPFCMIMAAALQLSAEESAVSEVELLIERGVEDNFSLISSKAAELSSNERMFLYERHKKEATVPFLLNFLLGCGIGSYIEGDTTGGTVGLVGELGSLAIVLVGYNSGIGYIGIATLLATRIYEIVRPFTFASNYNKELNLALLGGSVSCEIAPLVDPVSGRYGISIKVD